MYARFHSGALGEQSDVSEHGLELLKTIVPAHRLGIYTFENMRLNINARGHNTETIPGELHNSWSRPGVNVSTRLSPINFEAKYKVLEVHMYFMVGYLHFYRYQPFGSDSDGKSAAAMKLRSSTETFGIIGQLPN